MHTSDQIHRRGRSRRLLAAGLTATMLVTPATVASASGFTIDGLEPITFTEGGDPVRVAPNATISGSGGFADGYLRFQIADARETETLGLLTSPSFDTTAGEVSVVGDAIHLGLGDGTSKQIATVSSDQPGTAGQPLRIDFTAPLVNSDFSEGTQANGDPVGWTIDRGLVTLGSLASRTQQRPVSIAGSGPYTITGADYSFQTDFHYDPARHTAWGLEGDERALATPGNYSRGVVSHDGRSQALRLQMSGGWCESPNSAFAGPDGLTYCSSFGPDARSSTFEAKAGDDLAFDWAAAMGSDDYEVYGFLVNADTDEHHLLMYGRGYEQNWTTATGQIPADGTYQFRFVSGSYDRTGGRLLGASLYIDNARVLSSDATDDVATRIARLVTYHDRSDNPDPERQVTIEAETPTGGSPPPAEVPTEVELVDDPPVLDPPSDVVVVNDADTQTHGPVTGQLVATDPEDDPITYLLTDGEAHATTVGGVSTDQRQVGTTGTLHLDSATGAYVWVVDADLANATLEPSSETFAVHVDAYSDLHDQTLSDEGELTTRIDIAETAPSAPTALEATAGDRQVTLTWDAPWWTGGAEDVRYRVERLSEDTWQTVATDLTETTTTLTDLTNGATTELRVRATSTYGVSDPSPVVTTVPRTVPGAVADLEVEERDGELIVRWAEPDDDGGAAITGYEVASSHGTCTAETVTVEDDPRSWYRCLLPGLTNATTVAITVHAANVAGDGPTTTVTGTPYGAPLAPAVTVTRGDRQLQVDWTLAPANGRAIDGYELLIDGDVRATTGPDARTATVDGLTNGTSYTVAVRGTNLAGAGVAGTATAVPATVPASPVVHGVATGNRTLTVAFTAPVSDGGSPIAGYQYSVDGGTSWTSVPLISDADPLVLRGLTNGTRYDVRLRAFNAMGAGPATAAVPATPQLGAIRMPAPDSDGGFDDEQPDSDPRPGLGTPRVLVDGEPVDATLRPDGTRLHIEGAGFAIQLRGTEVDGTPMEVDGEGRLVVRAGGLVVVSGHGFAPGSTVDVWLFSEPHLLGEVEVDHDGTFAASLPLPDGIAPGEHTVQLNGVSADGELRSASTRVLVADREPVDDRDERSAAETVTPAPTSDRTALPRTGTTTGELALLALLVLGLGTGLLRVGGRSRVATRPTEG